MFSSVVNITSRYQSACKKYLSNVSIVADQHSKGVVIKPNTQGYNVLFLDYLTFAIETEIDNDFVEPILDYTLVN